MFDLIYQNIYKKPYKKKEGQTDATRNAKNEKICVEIDYDKLAEAVVKANIEAIKQYKQLEENQIEEQDIAWRKIVGDVPYEGDNKFYKAIDKVVLPSIVCWKLATFKEKNITRDYGLRALYKMCCSFLLFLYEWFFYALAICVPICILFLQKHLFAPVIALGTLILFILIARMIRVAKLEKKNCKDKKLVLSTFNAIVSFTAMVFAIVAIIV